MIPRLEKVDAVPADSINQAMLLGDPSRPAARQFKLQRFGLANTLKRIAQNGFDQFQNAKGCFLSVSTQ